jgi:hypothetical protein
VIDLTKNIVGGMKCSDPSTASFILSVLRELHESRPPDFESALKRLRQAGHGIAFDKSAVPKNLWNDPQIFEAEVSCIIQLVDDKCRRAVCLHEAGHAEFAERVGAVYVEFAPPAASYEGGVIRGRLAAIRPILPEGKSTIFNRTKISVAAEIVERELLEEPTGSVAADHRDILQLFDRHEASESQRRALLDTLETEILKDLRSPALKRNLWKRADFFKPILEKMIFPNKHLLSQVTE